MPWNLHNSLDQTLNEYRARQHWDRREYKLALEYAAAAAEMALARADASGYWRMTQLLAECQLELGLMTEFAASARELAEHPAIQADQRMLAGAKALYSRALGSVGMVTEALVLAQEAAALGGADDADAVDGVREIELLHGLVAALAESGREDEAWKFAQEMACLAAEQDNLEVAGKAYWAIGNVAFLADDAKNGVYYHELAAKNLAPGNDVNMWALFNKGSAEARLAAGVVEPETLECIERAELANSVTGGSPLQKLEISNARAHWLLLTGEAEGAAARLQGILEQRELLPEHTLAEVEFVLSLALHELGRNDEALVAAVNCEKVFNEHGARRRALAARGVIDSIGSQAG